MLEKWEHIRYNVNFFFEWFFDIFLLSESFFKNFCLFYFDCQIFLSSSFLFNFSLSFYHTLQKTTTQIWKKFCVFFRIWSEHYVQPAQ